MSVVEEFTAPTGRRTRETGSTYSGGKFVAALRILLAGMHASKEYRHLNGMGDEQLRMLGLSRDGIGQEVHRRHLAKLGGRFASID